MKPADAGSEVKRGGVNEWFDTSVFSPNALGTFGNSGRNSVRGPRYAAVDLGLQKTFPIAGSVQTQLRIEAFNVLNNVNLGLPVSAVNTA